LGELQFVGGDLKLWDCQNIKTLGKLKKVGGSLNLGYSSIDSLGELEFVGGNIYLIGLSTPPSELKKVEVGGRIV
jgi:hypothetical protein